MLRAVVAACIVGLLAGDAAGGLDTASSQRVAAKTTVFHDQLGEDPTGPDITTVTVSSGKDGLITFRVAIPTHPVLTEDMRIRVWLDADDDPTTGLTAEGLVGLDHFLLVDRGELGLGAVGLFRCSGTTCSGGKADAQSALRFSYRSGATFTVDAAELGLRRLERLRLSVVAIAGIRFNPVDRTYDVTDARKDVAPEEGLFWTYDAHVLRVRSFSATPARPQAGRPFALRMAAIRTDTGAVLTKGKLSCATRIAGTSVRARTSRFIGRQGVCVFEMPPQARGQRFRSSISILFGGGKVTRSLSGRIG